MHIFCLDIWFFWCCEDRLNILLLVYRMRLIFVYFSSSVINLLLLMNSLYILLDFLHVASEHLYIKKVLLSFPILFSLPCTPFPCCRPSVQCWIKLVTMSIRVFLTFPKEGTEDLKLKHVVCCVLVRTFCQLDVPLGFYFAKFLFF